jgi:chaperonin cofactor prefoldin
MRGLNNEIQDALAQFDNVSQQFQEFVTFLQHLDNRIRAQEEEMKGKPVP